MVGVVAALGIAAGQCFGVEGLRFAVGAFQFPGSSGNSSYPVAGSSTYRAQAALVPRCSSFCC